MSGCQLQPGCTELPTVLVGYSRRPDGQRVSMTVVPVNRGYGGIPGCVDHAHSALDGLLMDARGPARPPAIECTEKTDGEATA